jgi:transposase-like protein
VSVAAVALANGLNANYLRRWVKEYRERQAGSSSEAASKTGEVKSALLVPVQVDAPESTATGEIRVDIRRGSIAVQLAWPIGQAVSLGEWLKALLR